MADFQIDVLDASGKTAGSAVLPEALFDVEVNIPLLHQVVNAQLAAARAGTHKTKTRGEVRGGGRKPFRQKGTGRARQGSIRAPQFTGGGTVHGPQPRSYAQRTPKKMIAAALLQSLSDRARASRIHAVTAFTEDDVPSTKSAKNLLHSFTEGRRSLVVTERGEDTAVRSVRNLPEVHPIYVDQLNSYDVLVADHVVFTESALNKFVETHTKGEK
ncbi:large subunit ribosomal protein L4 [Actinobaculum suis]|uniref:Large ribosomal subunit protein uL4 n=1 Tax=Actinobaculum suis TaxID=1657 RepID=A0A1B9BDF0_9ACTO|nr:50S ribosomal protein L4 [Actinobaculum suis]MDY5153474.1 50S ribosomal protein L4 [Actinobaculum suis]OCA93440.1 50S ribosomal protein L4 [Actinobaculum suis]OCA95274.1 50S ribosomal protein L4 [Actinobaculum suis]SDE19166.1 large subunit ribosomal protein L4 [Actinobaculum suis]